MDDTIKSFLTEKVLLAGSDTLPPEVESRLELIRRDRVDNPVIFVSYGTAAVISGADRTVRAIEEFLEESGSDAITVKARCDGPADYEPMVGIQMPGKNRLLFRNVTDEKVDSLLNSVFHSDIPADDLVGQAGARGFVKWHGITFLSELLWYALQKRVVTESECWYTPENIEEYIARGGYRSFVKTIRHYTLEEVCDIIEKSGLRGRSGGGFPTGQKWKSALNTSSNTKYLICNAKESDPGGYTDRVLIENDPHRVIEVIAIAAYGTGATSAYIYLRAGARIAQRRLEESIARAREYGLLGHNIFSSGFNLDITVAMEAGAFVCGEETALIGSLSGKRGMPEIKPPFPAHSGLFGKPTVINNVETLMNVPKIMSHGPEWFRETGSENSSGTKVLALGGRTVRSGIVEVEMGTTLKTIFEEIAGGVADGGELKALQLGGALGSFIDPEMLETELDFESMASAGAGIGSGSFTTIGDDTCVVDLVRYYMDYLHSESCGKCIPCREGTGRMSEILRGITEKPDDTGEGTLERFKGVMQLETIAEVMNETSLCGLGQNAPKPFLSAIKAFRDEFEQHIFDRNCSANVCRELRRFVIDVEKCTGCTACASRCPVNAIYGTRLQPFFIVEDKCIGCGLCYEVCKFSAISVK